MRDASRAAQLSAPAPRAGAPAPGAQRRGHWPSDRDPPAEVTHGGSDQTSRDPAGAPALRLWQKDPVPGFLTTTGDMAAQSYLNRSGPVPMGYLPSMNVYSQLP